MTFRKLKITMQIQRMDIIMDNGYNQLTKISKGYTLKLYQFMLWVKLFVRKDRSLLISQLLMKLHLHILNNLCAEVSIILIFLAE